MRKKINHFEEEVQAVKKLFDIDMVMSFEEKHDVQVVRERDYQYYCFIDKKVYSSALTTLGALYFGISIYKELNSNE
jgi:hypothetical protein